MNDSKKGLIIISVVLIIIIALAALMVIKPEEGTQTESEEKDYLDNGAETGDYTIFCSIGTGKGTTGGECNTTVNHGSSVTVTALPAFGYKFVSWTGDASGTNASYNFNNVTSNNTAIANFEEELTYTDDYGGMWTVTFSNDGDRYNWPSAMSYCSNLIYGGYSNWHLPSAYQIRNDFGRSACNWDYYAEAETPIWGGDEQGSCLPNWDPNSTSSFYWSSSERDDIIAWDVYFNSGNVGNANKSDNNYHIRCRRDI